MLEPTTSSRPHRGWTAAFALAMTTSIPAGAFELPTVGGHQGEIDASAGGIGVFGDVEPTGSSSTHTSADIKRLTVGAGYTFGDAGPLHRIRFGVSGSYFISGREQLDAPPPPLPAGLVVTPEDKAGRVDISLSAFLLDERRYALRLLLDATIPVDVDLTKFSQERLHYVAGTLAFHLASHPGELVSVGNHSAVRIGSGAYGAGGRHNPQLRAVSLVSLDFARWLFPWRIGVAAGPTLEADLAGHTNRDYAAAFASVRPRWADEERVLALQVGGRVAPYFFITDDATLELAYEGVAPGGRDVRGTHRLSATLKVAF